MKGTTAPTRTRPDRALVRAIHKANRHVLAKQLDQALATGAVRVIRERAGWSLAEFADVVGAIRNAVANWETGRSVAPPGVVARVYGRLLWVLADRVMPSAR